MSEAPTVGELYRREAIGEDDLERLVHSWLDAPREGVMTLGECYSIDVTAAVRAHRPSCNLLGRTDVSEWLKRTMVRRAIVLAEVAQA